MRFGPDPSRQATSPPEVRQILDALDCSDDLVRVYYDTGHVIDGKGIYKRELRTAPFRGWEFADFAGHLVACEKPANTSSKDIHTLTGGPTDLSLFGWVVRHFAKGWLTCDDGPGEIADFIHVDHAGTLSLIHVKAALSSANKRTVAVSAYEVVAGQAVKNLCYLESERLIRALHHPPTSPAHSETSAARAAAAAVGEMARRSGSRTPACSHR
jgi:hypothetical protein